MKTLKPHFENQLFKKHYVYWAFGSVAFPLHTDVRPQFLFAKVGIADDTGRRIQGMQTDCPVVLHTVLGIPCPSKREAVALENVFKRSDELKGYNSHGEWFIVWGGPRDHATFLRRLIVLFYLYRNSHDGFLNVNMEWIASPFARQFRELVPGSDNKMLTVNQETRRRKPVAEFEMDSAVDAEIKTDALVECWYQPEKELKQAYKDKQAHMKRGAAHLDLPLKIFPMKQDDWKHSWFYTDGRSDFWQNY
jgi:hypothetical protein